MDNIIKRVEMPLDRDGFLSRECPTCKQRFKWHADEPDKSAGSPSQYFCPLCGAAASPECWWTQEQLDYAMGAAAPEIDRAVHGALDDAFRGIKGVSIKPNRNASLDIATPAPPEETDQGMVAVEPPCHPEEPLKLPLSISHGYCLVCGAEFAV